MRRYHIWTIGCQMNKAESERMAAYLASQGYRPADTPDQADLIILNSCVVRRSAEDRVRSRLNTLVTLKRLRPEVKLALTGCMVGGDLAGLRSEYPHVDYFFKAGTAPSWEDAGPPWLMRSDTTGPTTFVPIIQGCNNYCSYCIVPYRRGHERSRPILDIVHEVEYLVSRGTREVTLLGQNVDSYGRDTVGTPDLAALLRAVEKVGILKRIRFLTNHPKDMDRTLIQEVASLNKVCEHICLPVQAGSDRILRKMRRGYTVAQYRELIDKIRALIPRIALSTDVIVGFPGETDGDFQQTLDLLTEVKFDTVHVAAYSVRPGTSAARDFTDNVSPNEKKVRLAAVEAQQEVIAIAINQAFSGQSVEVLVEGRKQGKWWGRNRGNKLVFFTGDTSPGELCSVKITETSPWSLRGRGSRDQLT
jgi:tRNA-2-methylthio-N6-dimethylallyladenosine synthase